MCEIWDILRLDLAVAIFISCIFGTTPKIAQELYNANKNLTFHAQSLFLYKKMKKKTAPAQGLKLLSVK